LQEKFHFAKKPSGLSNGQFEFDASLPLRGVAAGLESRIANSEEAKPVWIRRIR
jgi:hypothetical protein